MNKANIIIKSFFLAVAVFSVNSCRRDNDVFSYAVPELIKVTSGADLAFKAKGGNGDISVSNLKGPLQVKTNQSAWCHLDVENDIIHVVVDKHDGLESRYAVVEMTAGEATGKTIVHQYGVILRSFSPENVTFKNTADQIEFPYDANESLIEAETTADWITLLPDSEKLLIKVSENEAKEYREGDVNWFIGDMKGSFTIAQFDPKDAGYLGQWDMIAYSGSGFKTKNQMSATLSENGDNYSLNIVYSTMNVTFPVKLDKNNLLLELGGMIGRRGNYFVFPLVGTGTTATTYDANIHEGYYPIYIHKDDDGNWVGNDNLDEFGTNMNFRFEMWNSEEHTGNSNSRLVVRNIQITKSN